MIITCNTSSLNKAIQTVQRAIASKPSTPIFAGIHFITANGKLEIQAMDLNMAISCTIDADIQEEGEIVVSAKRFSELIRKLSEENVTITQNKEQNTIKIESGTADFQLLLMNEEDYPKFPEFNGDTSITIGDEEIKELVKKTVFACAKEEAKPLFTGILVEVADNKITFVGTNTHRLAIKSMPYESSEPMSIIIPYKVLEEINRNLTGEVPQEVKISLLKNQIMVSIDNVVIVSRLIEGKFPDYRRVVPPKFSITAKVNVKEMANSVERVSLFSNQGEYSVVKVSVEDGKMTIMSSSPDVGSGKEIIDCVSEGDKLNVAFNSKYVLDILKNLEAEEAIFSMNTSYSPVCVTSESEPGYTYIVTPIRVVF